MTEAPQSDLDALMEYLAGLDAKDVSLWTDHDIDVIIAMQRRSRAQREAGIKPKRPKAESTVKLTLADLGFKPSPALEIKRRL